LTVQQAEGIKHAVGMGDVVATVLKCLFHECRQIELVLHQKQIAGRLAGRARHEVGLWSRGNDSVRRRPSRRCGDDVVSTRSRACRAGSVHGWAGNVDDALAITVDTAAVPARGVAQ
jgi:hypothetical protein